MKEERAIIVGLNVVLITLSVAATASRVWRRVFVVRKFELQDGLITLACISATIFSSCQIVASAYGLGDHMVNMNMTTWPTLIKILMASNTFYFLCNWAIKHALLLFYADLTTSRSHLRLICLMHFVAFGFGLSSILVDLFQCRPMRKNWDRGVEGWCADKNAFYYANAAIMLVTDCVLYGMPLVFTRGLRLRRKQRWGLRCLFGLGGLVIAASAARVVSTHLFATRPDYPYRFANVMIWAVIENHLAVVVSCAPSLKVIILLTVPRLASSLPKFLSRLTRSRTRSYSSPPPDIEIASAREMEDSRTRSPLGKGGMLEVETVESPLPSPMTPVFLGKWGRRSEREEGWVFVGERGVQELRMGHSTRIERS